MIVKRYAYRGHTVIGVFENLDSEYPLVSFGLKKWNVILEMLEEIKKAVRE